MLIKYFTILFFVLCTVQPSFSEQLINENFDDQSFSPMIDYASAGGPEIVSFGSARSGSYVCKFDGSSITEGLWWEPVGGIDDNGGIFYAKYYVYYPDGNWDFESISTTGLKQFRFYYPNNNDNTWMIKNQYSLETDPGTIQLHTGDAIWSSVYGVQNVTTLNPKDAWHKVETYLYYDYDGTSHMTVWFNDIQVWDSDGDIDGAGWTVGNIWAVQMCAGNGFGTAGYYYVDDLEVWDSYPPSEEPSYGSPKTYNAGSPAITVGGSTSLTYSAE